MESRVQPDSSFSEFFSELRQEAETFFQARRPLASAKVRKLSSGSTLHSQVESLQRENEELKARIKLLEEETEKMRAKCSESEATAEKYAHRLAEALNAASGKLLETSGKSSMRELGDDWLTSFENQLDLSRLHTSFSQSAVDDDVHMVELNLCSQPQSTEGKRNDEVERLKERVKKHQAFIQHLKCSLEQLLIERTRERAEHLRTKSRLNKLLSTSSGAMLKMQ